MNARPLAVLALLAFANSAVAFSPTKLRILCPDGSPAEINEKTGEQRCAVTEEAPSPSGTKQQVSTGLIIEEHPYETGYHPMPRWFQIIPTGHAEVDPGADSDAGAFDVSTDPSSAAAHFASTYAGDLFGWVVAESDGSLFASAPGYGLLARYDAVSAGGDYSIDDADASVYGDGMLGFDMAATSAGVLASAPFDSAGGSVYLIGDAGSGWSSVSDAASVSVESADAGAAFGYRVLAADVDGDGEDDLIASAPGTGQVFLFFGLSGLDGLTSDDADAVLTGGEGSFAGYDIATVTDAEGAVSHLLIGAPGDDTAYVVAADDAALGGALDAVAETILSGESDSRFGHRVLDFGGATVGVSSPDGGLLEALDIETGALVGVWAGDAEARFGVDVSAADLDGDGTLDVSVAELDGEDVAISTLLSSSLD